MDRTQWFIIAFSIFVIFIASFAFQDANTSASQSYQPRVIDSRQAMENTNQAQGFQIALGVIGLAGIIWGIVRK